MAIAPVTPRDRLQRLVDLGRKTWRYGWLVAVFAVVGGALSLVFALTRARQYHSYAVLFYQERIQSSLLSGREEAEQRNIGDHYRELLLARAQLKQIIADPKLDPFPEIPDPELALEKLRKLVKFEARGGNTFRIEFTDVDANRAKAVTEKLTKMLQDKDAELGNETAHATVSFVLQQKDEASTELRKREQKLAEFLAKHPEFAQDPNQQGGEGASIRAIRNQKQVTGNTKLYALERQRRRLQARIDASLGEPVVHVPAPPSPEKIAAEAAVSEAQRELAEAKRDLEQALAKYTERHPTVISAQDRVATAQQRLRHAQAAVPDDVDAHVAPATPADRKKLQKELDTLEKQIAEEQKGKGAAVTDASTNWVVQLETQHADLRRSVAEQRERVQSLADSAFRAQMDANQKLAEQGGRLSVVDPAFKPVVPTGPGKTIFMLAGMVLFLSLGGSLAIGLAVIDDRLYRRADLDQLGIPVLAVIPHARAVKRERKRRRAARRPPTNPEETA
jgi:uncharacterized protein involved in exopolysaccharide biosynthesis